MRRVTAAGTAVALFAAPLAAGVEHATAGTMSATSVKTATVAAAKKKHKKKKKKATKVATTVTKTTSTAAATSGGS